MGRPKSAALHRAKRKKETAWRDQILRIADQCLDGIGHSLAQAALAAACRPEDAVARIQEAQRTLKECRTMLVIYYDDPMP
jgi:hypothetical protein